MRVFTSFILILLPLFGFSQSSDISIFLPGIVSTRNNERDMAIAPDGKELFYTLQSPRNGISVILRSVMKQGQWTNPEVAPFSGQYSDLEPAFSPDGKRLFFVSNRPVKAGEIKKDYDIWFMEKSGSEWGTPQHGGFLLNTEEDEYYPSVTKDGSVYFTAVRPDAQGEDIYKSQWLNGQFQTPKNIGAGVNSKLGEFNAFIDPDEKYIIFGEEKGEGDLGGGDLYISYKNQDGTWTKGKNLGAPVNSNRLDYCPFVYAGNFYFTSERASPLMDGSRKFSLTEINERLGKPGNGFGDIYVIKLDKIVGR